MARQLTFALALASSFAFIGCAEEPKPTTETPAAAPAGETKPADAPKEGAMAPAGDMAKPAEAPAK